MSSSSKLTETPPLPVEPRRTHADLASPLSVRISNRMTQKDYWDAAVSRCHRDSDEAGKDQLQPDISRLEKLKYEVTI